MYTTHYCVLAKDIPNSSSYFLCQRNSSKHVKAKFTGGFRLCIIAQREYDDVGPVVPTVHEGVYHP